MAFRTGLLLLVLIVASCAQGGAKLPPDQLHVYDGLYTAQVERLGGTPVYCETVRTSAKPWLIVDGEIRFRQNAAVGFNAPIAPDLTFYRSLPNGVVLSGRVSGGDIVAETDNPLLGYDCHYRFMATKVQSLFPENSPWDGSYKGLWTTLEDRNAQDAMRVLNGGCVGPMERTFIVRRGYIASSFSSSDVIAAPLREDGTFEREQGGWRFAGAIRSGVLKATVTSQTCTVAIEAKKA